MTRFFTILFLCSLVYHAKAQSNYDNDLLNKDFHKLRRAAVLEKLPEHSAAIFFAAPERNRANDIDFTYHQDPNLYYLSGYPEANAVLFLFKDEQTIGGISSREFIYVQDKDPSAELWTGRRLGTEGTRSELGIPAISNTQLAQLNIDFKTFEKVYFTTVPKGAVNDKRDPNDLYDLIELVKSKTGYPEGNTNGLKLNQFMAELRMKKMPEELALMRKACEISCEGIKDMARTLNPGMKEYQAQAIVEYHFKKNGSEYVGYPCIVGGAENSCIFHYETNRRQLKNGDILLADVGAEYHGYSADVTRTLPVNGKFSAAQKIIYELVLKAQEEGIKAAVAGNPFNQADKVAREIITQGLLDLGIIKEKTEARKYFQHGTSTI